MNCDIAALVGSELVLFGVRVCVSVISLLVHSVDGIGNLDSVCWVTLWAASRSKPEIWNLLVRIGGYGHWGACLM